MNSKTFNETKLHTWNNILGVQCWKQFGDVVMIIILFVENVLSQCRGYSVVLFSEMKIYQIYVIREMKGKLRK